MSSNQILLFLAAILLASCTKELVTENHPEFVGSWLHHTKESHDRKLYIFADGTGYLAWIGPYFDESKTRKWFLANDKLFFGKHRINAKPDANYIMHIDVYPTVSNHDFIYDLDTVSTGETYMILDGHAFVKQ